MINKITLFEFQENAVSFLLEKTTDIKSKRKIIIKSPTGSGKTIILLSYIDNYRLNINPNKIFIWLTPGKGDLEEQSKEKMEGLLPNSKTGDIHDILLHGFNDGFTYFVNWEMITNKKNTALKDTERKNLFERIADAHRKKQEFILLIDEEHLNNTVKAKDIIDALNAEYQIRVSATTVKSPSAEYYEISESEVIESGLITKAMHINDGIDIDGMYDLESEADYLLEISNEKRKKIKKAYQEEGINVNPLVIIQFPDMSGRLIEYVEDVLNEMGYSYENGLVSKWLSDEKINVANLTEDNAISGFLLMKQAISTGWDCPRAKILVKLRENMSETFELQTFGRIRRMPEARHYENNHLDYCFLYTFDEKFKFAAIQQGHAYEVKRLFLKKEYRDFDLIKEERSLDFQYVNERDVLNKSYDYFIEKYGLSSRTIENRNILEAHGYKFGTKITSRYRVGEFAKLRDILDTSQGSLQEMTYEVNTHTHGIDCLHAVDVVKKVMGLPSNKTRAILRHLFFRNLPSSKKLLKLTNREWYAFMINNQDKLQGDFRDLATKPMHTQLQLLPKRETKFKLPLEDFYRYLPHETDISIFENNAYLEYDTSMTALGLRSTSEQLFEYYVEENSNVEWFYKNGESGKQYLSILYRTNLNREYLFYPDYIVKMKNGDVWIIETKGGESYGQSKNIDKNAFNKFEAFKQYSENRSIKWGFVRDRNNRLYINNQKYTEEMNTPEWVRLETMLG